MTFSLVYFPIFCTRIFLQRNQKMYNLYSLQLKCEKFRNGMWCNYVNYIRIQWLIIERLNRNRMYFKHFSALPQSCRSIINVIIHSYTHLPFLRSKTHATYNFPAFVVAQRRVVPSEILFAWLVLDGIYIKKNQKQLSYDEKYRCLDLFIKESTR